MGDVFMFCRKVLTYWLHITYKIYCIFYSVIICLYNIYAQMCAYIMYNMLFHDRRKIPLNNSPIILAVTLKAIGNLA